MYIIKMSIIFLWASSLLLNYLPLYTYSYPINGALSLALTSVIIFGASSIKSRRPTLATSIIDAFGMRVIFNIAALALILTSAAGLLILLLRGTSMTEARQYLWQSLHFFTYSFVAFWVYPLFVIYSSRASNFEKRLSAIALILILLLLLYSGNRQFAFFFITFIIFYYVGTSNSQAINIKRLISAVLFVITVLLMIAYYRLSYLEQLTISTAAKYMKTFTGLDCSGAEDYFCDGPIDFVLNLFYLYFGVNHVGLAAAFDYAQFGELNPIFTSVPIVDQLLQVLGFRGFHSNMGFEKYLYSNTGLPPNFVFLNMFGSPMLEIGLPGIILSISLWAIALKYFFARATAGSGTKLDYIIFIYICALTCFGIMLFPFYERFIFVSFINLMFLKLIEVSVNKVRVVGLSHDGNR